jgi:hypothetical protein
VSLLNPFASSFTKSARLIGVATPGKEINILSAGGSVIVLPDGAKTENLNCRKMKRQKRILSIHSILSC